MIPNRVALKTVALRFLPGHAATTCDTNGFLLEEQMMGRSKGSFDRIGSGQPHTCCLFPTPSRDDWFGATESIPRPQQDGCQV